MLNFLKPYINTVVSNTKIRSGLETIFSSNKSVNIQTPLHSTLSNHIFYYPTPSNITYNWSFGSLVGLFFARQLVTGIFLARHYTPHTDWAFTSVEHIRTDVRGGYTFRYRHSNGASRIFILRYAHLARNLYYQSYRTRPALWYTGLVIFLLRRATGFIGYVLPWGQRSFWGATVITKLVTAIPVVGQAIAEWVWGGPSIDNATLNRFFSLHYLLPFLVTGIIRTHLTLLHVKGSTDPLTRTGTPDKVTFHPYFSAKDAFIFSVAALFFVRLIVYAPNHLGHADNFIAANPLSTPAHIVPEWYFTPFYAILRACPNKIGGAVGRGAAILSLFAIPTLVKSSMTNRFTCAHYTPVHKVFFWSFAGVFLTLRFLGSRAAAEPYVRASKLFTTLYFVLLLIVLPLLHKASSYLAARAV